MSLTCVLLLDEKISLSGFFFKKISLLSPEQISSACEKSLEIFSLYIFQGQVQILTQNRSITPNALAYIG